MDKNILRLAEETAKLQAILLKHIRYGVESSDILDHIMSVKEQLNIVQKELPPPHFKDMVEEVIHWFKNSEKRDQYEFIETPFDRLSVFHSSIGRMIRDRFNLWHYGWEEKKVNGVDISPNHPDNISMRVIEEVWRQLHDKS